MTTRRNLFKLAAVAPLAMPPSLAHAEEVENPDDWEQLQAIVTSDTSAFDTDHRAENQWKPPERIYCPTCEPTFLARYPRLSREILGLLGTSVNVMFNGEHHLYAFAMGEGWIDTYSIPFKDHSEGPGHGVGWCSECVIEPLHQIVYGDVVLDIDESGTMTGGRYIER